MTEVQALSSKEGKELFNANVRNVRLPGTNMWVDGNKLCLNDDMIQSIKPLRECFLWKVRLEDGVNKYKYFENASAARSFAEDSSDATGSATCAKRNNEIYSHPIMYKAEVCNLWAVKTRVGKKTATFKYYSAALDFAENDEDAWGSAPYCADQAIVTKSAPTQYIVDFYAKITFPEKSYDGQFDEDLEVGTHTYPMSNCGAGSLTPVPAN